MDKYINKNIIILFVAILITLIASYMSVYGLSLLFGGNIIVILMASFLEISKLVLITIYHNKKSLFSKIQKIYILIALIVLYSITSLGIFGYLKNSSIDTIMQIKKNELLKDNIRNKLILYETKKKFVDSNLIDISEKINLINKMLTDNSFTNLDINLNDSSYKNLRLKAYTLNQAFKYQSNMQKELDKKLNIFMQKYNYYDSINNVLSDSINYYKLKLMENKHNIYKLAKDIGSFYSLSQVIYSKEEINSYQLEHIINIFILILIFVFDPVALVLIISFLQIQSSYDKVISNKQNVNNLKYEKNSKKNKLDENNNTLIEKIIKKENVKNKNNISTEGNITEKKENLVHKDLDKENDVKIKNDNIDISMDKSNGLKYLNPLYKDDDDDIIHWWNMF